MREHSENRLFELKAAFIDVQKDSEGQKTINSLLRNQISDIQKDLNRHADLVLDKDRTIDKLKEEIVRMSRSMADSIRELTPKDTTHKDYEAMSSHEFTRLRQLTDELKDRQVELERCKMQEDIHQRQYLELKQKLVEATDEKNNSKRQQDAIAYENQRLKEEQDKFLSDLGEVRQIYESQIDLLAIKLRESAEETLRQKANSAEISKENSQLKFRINEYKQKMASKDVDIQKLTSEKLFELGGVPRTKPTDFLASPSMLRVALENDSQFEGMSPEGREDTLKVLGRLKRTDSPEPTKDIWKEDKMKLEWDSLLHRIGTLGSK